MERDLEYERMKIYIEAKQILKKELAMTLQPYLKILEDKNALMKSTILEMQNILNQECKDFDKVTAIKTILESYINLDQRYILNNC